MRYFAIVENGGAPYRFATVWSGHETPDEARAAWRNEHCVGRLVRIEAVKESE